MAEQLELTALPREEAGKGACRELRRQGLIPGIYYDGSGQNVPVKVDGVALEKVYGEVGHSYVFTLKVEGGLEKPTLIRELKRHPFKNQFVHVDFFGVDLTKKALVDVPVEVLGEAPGVNEGGVLTLFHDYLTVECLPLKTPHSIQIDVSELNINDSVNIEDVKLPADVEIHYDENFAVLGVQPPQMEPTEEELEAEEAEEAGEEAAEGEESAEGEEESGE
ncbi:50S ribosomal protein L25 [Desulfohalovibrio reitneri]|jgi:large subunit ribosomal protein L25|uniref:50S ribosomal protein L25 n=1 Tax=Desulfohalovibrio reitneri TaxID=1307759 RepID=UPI0004A77D97|nr:50S ribosomal protein L25 [Desulfohalovibrio reitneri]